MARSEAKGRVRAKEWELRGEVDSSPLPAGLCANLRRGHALSP
jgi:hypothetical protein